MMSAPVYPVNLDLAISRSPPQCPDLDQSEPDPDEAAGLTRPVIAELGPWGETILMPKPAGVPGPQSQFIVIPKSRAEVVAEALSWIGTPYRAAQRVKGREGGVDCLTFVLEVFARCGYDTRFWRELPFYPQDWHLHRDDERYMRGVLEYARPIPGPPEPGDIVLFRFGRCYSHGGIVTAWPMIVHAWVGGGVMPVDATQAFLGPRPRRFFSPFS